MNLIKSLSLLSLPLFSFVTAQATTNQGVEPEASVIQSPARMGLTKQPVVHETGVDVAVSYAPLSDYMLRFGLNVNWMISPQWHVGASFLTGEEPYFSMVGGAVNEATLNGNLWVVKGRFFSSRNLFLSGGFGQRSASMDYRAIDEDQQVQGSLSMKATVASVGIGQHWQSSQGFTLTIDWLSYAHPLSDSVEETEAGTPTSVPLMVAQADMVHMGKTLAGEGAWTIGTTSFGWRF